MKYKLEYDYHTHTIYSHGKGTIEDNVKAAYEKGLRSVAISDHGPGHIFYGIDKNKIPHMRKEIDRLRSVYQSIEIFLAVEANILNTGTGIDVRRNEVNSYDFILAGYHWGVRNGYCAENFFYNTGKRSFSGAKKLLQKNTDMVVKAIYENPIKVLTHPCDKGPFDIAEIAKACADRRTLLEINSSHANLTVSEIKEAAKVADVRFIVSSDAHVPEKVGVCDVGILRAIEAGLDMSRIVNISEK